MNSSEIIKKTLKYYKKSPVQVFKKTRKRDVVEIRQHLHAILLLCGRLGIIEKLSLNDIAKLTGRKYGKFIIPADHALILYSYSVVRNLYQTDKKYNRNLKILLVNLGIKKELEPYLLNQKILEKCMN